MAQIVRREVGKAIQFHKAFNAPRDRAGVVGSENIFFAVKDKRVFQNRAWVFRLHLLSVLLEQPQRVFHNRYCANTLGCLGSADDNAAARIVNNIS